MNRLRVRAVSGVGVDSLRTFVVICFLSLVNDHLGPLGDPLGTCPSHLLVHKSSDEIGITKFCTQSETQLTICQLNPLST